jgi:hypothetical protein
MIRTCLYIVVLRQPGKAGEAAIERGLTKEAARKAVERLTEEYRPAFTAKAKPMGWRVVA